MIKIFFTLILSFCLFPSIAQEARLYKQNDKWGLLNADKKPLTLAIYDQIIPGIPYSIVKKYDPATAKYSAGCVNALGELTIPLTYADLKIEGLRVIACQKNPTGFVYGIVSFENSVIIPLHYKSVKALGTLRFAVENSEGKIALFTENGKALTNFILDHIHPFKKEYCVFEQNGLVGLLDREGSIKIKPQYRDIQINNDGSVIAQKLNEWHWIDSKNKPIQSFSADSVSPFPNNTYLIKNRKGYAVIDQEMKQQTIFYKHLVQTCQENIFIGKNIKSGAMDAKGSVLLPEIFDSVYVDSKYIYALSQKGWLVYSHAGKLLIEKGYQQISTRTYFIYVKRNGFWGALDASGKETVACVYDSIYDSNAQQLVVGFKENYGIISASEEWLTAPQSLMIQLVNDKVYLLQDRPLLTLKDFDHRTVHFTNNPLMLTDKGLIEKTSHGEVWHVSFTGIVTKLEVRPVEYVTTIENESEGYRAIQKDGKWGFVDAQGRLRIPNRYEGVQNFSETLAAFSLRKKWGFLNHDDQIIIQPAYEEASNFINGLSIVKQKGLYGILNKQGQLVLPCRYQSIQTLPSVYFQLQNENLYGLASPAGVLQYEPKYTSQKQFGTSMIVERNKKYGVIDSSGRNVIPMMYDYIIVGEKKDEFLVLVRNMYQEVRL